MFEKQGISLAALRFSDDRPLSLQEQLTTNAEWFERVGSLARTRGRPREVPLQTKATTAYDSMTSSLTSAELEHFATLSEVDQEMARVMVRLRHRGLPSPPQGAFAPFYRLAGVNTRYSRDKSRDISKQAVAPLVESFLASLAAAMAALAQASMLEDEDGDSDEDSDENDSNWEQSRRALASVLEDSSDSEPDAP